MNLEQFAEVTQLVIKQNGFDGFVPTLYLPGRLHLVELEGVPDEKLAEIRSISLEWARQTAGEEDEYLLVFKEDEASFRIIRSFRGEISEGVFPVV